MFERQNDRENDKSHNINQRPIYLHFRNLSVWMKEDFFTRTFSKLFPKSNSLGLTFMEQIQTKDAKKGTQILSDVSGFIAPGQLVAILGTSGSGKTTLLNTLAYRLRSTRRGVTITQEGFKANAASLFYFDANKQRWISSVSEIRNLVGYVTQEDCLLPNLTCYETLCYAGLFY